MSGNYQQEDDYDHINNTLIYSSTNIPGPGCNKIDFDSCPNHKCTCTDLCKISTCNCIGDTYNYDTLHRIISPNRFINECNEYCACITCQNRVVQLGPRIGLRITACKKGYGLYTDISIQKGQFICEYAGEIIDLSEAQKRTQLDSDNYIFVLNEHFFNHMKTTVIDNTYIGNIGRYINHSCQPNCVVVPVRVNSFIPRLAIFAIIDIGVGEEITYHYGVGNNSSTESSLSKTKCLCSSTNCKGYLPSKTGLF
ncbi:probable histone-lysine N-methyltransferase set-23 [Adelges cooleyi]|uniref:probable histone-lysine N-methyltransferase set-23 n=1 Tax=Adelges cooleyi TaxID=133065 RepID=UPI0021800CFC|nr:probable histone-lysine N-methyltransferase set-23 [Adelges cooleyi]